MLCTEAPEAEDSVVDGGWSKACDIDGDGEPTGVKRCWSCDFADSKK